MENETVMCRRCGKVPPYKPQARYCEECKTILRRERNRASEAKRRKRRRRSALALAYNKVQNTKTCDGCKYWKQLSGVCYCCHYAIDTGTLRKIPASECYKHEGTPYERK